MSDRMSVCLSASVYVCASVCFSLCPRESTNIFLTWTIRGRYSPLDFSSGVTINQSINQAPDVAAKRPLESFLNSVNRPSL